MLSKVIFNQTQQVFNVISVRFRSINFGINIIYFPSSTCAKAKDIIHAYCEKKTIFTY